jgi:hypothetical protein
MPYDLIKISICNGQDEAESQALADASNLYWEKKGYKLLSEDTGEDMLSVYKPSLKDNKFEIGEAKYSEFGSVILIHVKPS